MSSTFLRHLALFFQKNDDIYSMIFWDSVKQEIKKQNTTQDWVILKTGIPYGTFRGWVNKARLPDVAAGVKIAQVLQTSVEYLVAGNHGTEYLKNLPELQGTDFQPPARIKDIVKALSAMNDSELEVVKRVLFGGLLGEANEDRKIAT